MLHSKSKLVPYILTYIERYICIYKHYLTVTPCLYNNNNKHQTKIYKLQLLA